MSVPLNGRAEIYGIAPSYDVATEGRTPSQVLPLSRTQVRLSPTTHLLRGRDAILQVQPMLAALAEGTNQGGDADNLAHFLATPDALKKTPHLLLFADEAKGSGTSAPMIGAVSGAVLLFEYRVGGRGSRIFSTADYTGRRSVFGQSERRAELAAQGARTLVDRGAHIVQIAYSETHRSGGDDTQGTTPELYQPEPRQVSEQHIRAELGLAGPWTCKGSWTLLKHEIPLYLPLGPSFEATLARIGQRTRSNLRYYRRRSEADLGCSFNPDVHISLADFLAFNRECMYAVPDALARWRYNTLGTLSHPFLRGIRDNQGRWLSLVGGRRQSSFAEIDWQMNRADLPAYSLSTVMRSYVLEYEIAAGSTRLYIEGGTPSPLARSFASGRVGELTLRRNSTYVRLLRDLAPKVFPTKNYVAQTLQNPNLHWENW